MVGSGARKILVVGGAGYLGGLVVDELIAKASRADSGPGINVVVYDNLFYGQTFDKPVQLVRGDVRNTRALGTWLDWADCVIWLAAIVGDVACDLIPKVSKRTNLESIDGLVESPASQIIFPSSCSVYGASDGLLTEESATNPLSLYAEMKLRAEEILAPRATILRLGTLGGYAGDFNRQRFDLVLNIFVDQAYAKNSVTVFGGMQKRALLSVWHAAITIADLAVDGSPVGIFNIADDNLTILELARKVADFIGGVEIRVSGENPDKRSYAVDCSKAQFWLSFEPIEGMIIHEIRMLSKAIFDGKVANVGAGGNNAKYIKENELSWRKLLS